MKKLITLALAIMLIAAMTIPAHAVTPSFKIPDMPEIPDISDDIKIEVDISDSFWDKWFDEHPIVLPIKWMTFDTTAETEAPTTFTDALKKFVG